MSSILSCRDARFECVYPGTQPARAAVDVSTSTLVSMWDAGRSDDAGCRRELSQLVPVHAPLHDTAWPDPLSPHLQRNKQLQDTLMQKEEELARLQEENNKLKEFLNSSYVKTLEDKSKRVFSEEQHRKRALHDETDFVNLSRLLQGGTGKRTCRNLSLEFCSADEVAATPPLDSWVLETLGLQDEDTINADSSLSSHTTDHTPTFSSPAPSMDHFSPALQDSTMYSPYSSDSHCEYNAAIDSSCGPSHGMNGGADLWTLGMSRMYTVTSTGSLRDLPNGHFSPPKATSTPQRPHVPSSDRRGHGFSSPTADDGAPSSTRSRTDLAFSMSLSPQNSVKTHTFPQGQAFTRRDSQGGWNFTWLPKQCS